MLHVVGCTVWPVGRESMQTGEKWSDFWPAPTPTIREMSKNGQGGRTYPGLGRKSDNKASDICVHM